MIKKILALLGILLFGLVAVVLFNTFRARSWPIVSSPLELFPMPDSASAHLSHAVQIPTISISDTSAIDTVAFKAFGVFIERAYPLVHQHLSKTLIRQFSYVFEWKGQNSSLDPIILMGHYDVVPVESAALGMWTVAPFSGTITDSCIWGRGSTDDKMGVISILEGTERMLANGFVPQRTIFLCFGHDEEISGRGARAIVEYLKGKKVRPEMVLDEGGEITETKAEGVRRPVAVIGVAEKGYASFELTVQKEGGHSSMPDKETSIDILATALHLLRSKPPAATITPPVKEFLNRIGTSSDIFLNKMATSNMWLFEGITKSILSHSREGSAMIQTTIVPTILQAGFKDNAIPTTANAIINTRILPGETSQSVEKYIRETISDDRVKIKKIGQFNSDPSPPTSTGSAAFKRVESAVYKTIPNVIPAPHLMIGATDSRQFRVISDGVVNFFPMTDSRGFHGINERLPLRDLQRSIAFIRIILEEGNKEFK